MSSEEAGGGRRKERGSRSWAFTINNPTGEDEVTLARLATSPTVRYLVYGREVAPTTGTLHLQCFVYLSDAKSTSALQTWHGQRTWHFEPCRSSNSVNIAYCKKEGNFTEFGTAPSQGLRVDFDVVRDMVIADTPYSKIAVEHPAMCARYKGWVKEQINERRLDTMPIDNLVLYQWQQQILDYIMPQGCFKIPEPREIIWIWSDGSATGKSSFMQWLQATHRGDVLCAPNFKWQDIVYLYDQQRVLWFNIPRDPGDEMRNIYHVLEKASDRGLATTGKYEGAQKCLSHMHVIVTANIPPDEYKLPKRFKSVVVDDFLNAVFV